MLTAPDGLTGVMHIGIVAQAGPTNGAIAGGFMTCAIPRAQSAENAVFVS